MTAKRRGLLGSANERNQVEPYYQDEAVTLYCGDCLEVLQAIDASSFDMVFTDPPYFKVKDEWWDKQWNTPSEFVDWISLLCDRWQDVLRPNGSLYVFASPQMAWHVEGEIRKRFNLVNRITWKKTGSDQFNNGMWSRSCKEQLRSFFPQTETLFFAEHFGADNMAKGEAGYVAKCDELRGFVFEPLRAYLDGERERAGCTLGSVNKAWQEWKGGKGGMSSHWFTRSQWALPTAANYEWLRSLFNRNSGDCLRREYEDLRREYEDLRREYEDLRRPFSVTADMQYTDVWSFKSVASYTGKHPCEKPADLLAHVVMTSTKPDAVIFDCFGGSFRLAEVCKEHGRKFVGIEISERYCEIAAKRLSQGTLF